MWNDTPLILEGWCNIQVKRNSVSNAGPSLKRARLDRALGIVDLRISWPNEIVHHLQTAASDHNPILLDTTRGRQGRKGKFKYELLWERDPRVLWVVKRAWLERRHTNPMVNLYRKLKDTNEHLTKCNKTHFRKLTVQIEEARSRLAEIKKIDEYNEEEHARTRNALNEALTREEIFWKQKSRVAWLKDVDKATKFFMASTVTRRRKNFIQAVKDEKGMIYEDIGDIAQLFIDKFTKTFSAPKKRKTLCWEGRWSNLNSSLLGGI